jgi:hypothetical protein
VSLVQIPSESEQDCSRRYKAGKSESPRHSPGTAPIADLGH